MPVPTYSAIMHCGGRVTGWYNDGNIHYSDCDSTDNDSSIIASKLLNNGPSSNQDYLNVISHDKTFNNGWRLYKIGGANGYGFHFIK